MERELIIGRVKIGEAVKIARNAKGMSQGQLADLCGIDQPMISRIESGNENVSEKKIKFVCDVLGIGNITIALEKNNPQDFSTSRTDEKD